LLLVSSCLILPQHVIYIFQTNAPKHLVLEVALFEEEEEKGDEEEEEDEEDIHDM
jgi:hypothetical protein